MAVGTLENVDSTFDSLETYGRFFQEHRLSSGSNSVMMFVPDPQDRMVLCRTGLWDPFEDKDLTRIISLPEFADVEYYIAPVMKTPERLARTIQHNYRFDRDEEVIARYRQEMNRGDFFPLLGFDARRDYWPSGEHRLRAGTSFDAHFSMVFPHLSNDQVTMLYEKTNLHHSNGYNVDERCNLFFDLRTLPGVTNLEAYGRAGLTKRATNGRTKTSLSSAIKVLVLAGTLVRLYPAVLETGGGRRRPMSTVGAIAECLGGERAIAELSEEDWNLAFSLGTGTFTGPASGELNRRGFNEKTPKERLETYVQVQQTYARKRALRKQGITNALVDDKGLLDIAQHIVSFQKAGLGVIYGSMSEENRNTVARATYLLNLVFGEEADVQDELR